MASSKKRQLAAILFADIAGYTAMMQKDEHQARQIVLKFKNTINEKVAGFHGQVIQFYGDGCLCTFDSAVDAMQCAHEVQLVLQTTPIVPVRIGVHSGDVFFEADNVYGDSVNVASRIESLGVSGGVLFSNQIKRHISNHTLFQFQSLGFFEFKNVEQKMEVFALANEGIVVPKAKDLQGKFKTKAKPNSWWLLGLIGAICLAIFVYWNGQSDATIEQTGDLDPVSTAAEIPPNSLAVLPFANMSMDRQNSYFSEGIHDDLLSQLSKISSMKVISRTSVLRFKDSKLGIPEIAKMLAVANILEGSVRLTKDQVRINVQLIEANTDKPIWAETYDKELTSNNIFDIQTEIAKAIATALKTNISSTQQVALENRPTQNLEAYEAYLRARQLVEERVGSSILEAKTYLEKAIELDPAFAKAYVKLGEVYYLLVEYASEDSKTNYERAWAFCEKAKAINPNLAEVYGLECTLYHYDKGDIELAKIAYEKAIAINPNYADVHFWYSHAIIEIEKNPNKALAILERAIQLNPLSPKFINRLAQTYMANGQLQKAIDAYHKGMELAPNHIFLPRNLTFLYAYTGRLDSSALVAYQTIQRNGNDPKYLRSYIETLVQLDMQSEIQAELDNFNKETREDSLFYFRLRQQFSLRQGMFEDSEKYLQILTDMDNDANSLDPTLSFDVFYYNKDFHQIVAIFEQNYPNILTTDYFQHTMFSGYNRKLSLQDGLQKYIYSLMQIGQTEKASELIDLYGHKIIEPVNPNGDPLWEKQKRTLFEIKNTIILGQYEKAIAQFEKWYNGSLIIDWHFLLIDPIFDRFKTDNRYLAVVTSIESQLVEQQRKFRMHLINE